MGLRLMYFYSSKVQTLNMKRLFAILFLFVSCKSISQTFLPPRSSATTTVQDSRWRALLTMYMPHTRGLTLNGGLDTLGAVIYDDSSAHIWYRDTVPSGGHKWSMILKTGDAGQGTLTQLNTGLGLTGGPITTTGTIVVDTSYNANGLSHYFIRIKDSTTAFVTPTQMNAQGFLKTVAGIALGGDLAGSTLPNPVIAANAVSFGKFQQIPGFTFVANPTASPANTQASYFKYGLIWNNDSLKVDTNLLKTVFGAATTPTGITQLTGDVVAGPGFGSQGATIGNNKVTYGKFQQAPQQGLLGATAAGNYQHIIVGLNLFMSGDTLNAIGGGGGGNPLVNNGAGYRLVEPISGGNYPINSLVCAGCTLDSTSHSGSLTITVSGGGGGNTNSNIGSGYRFAIPSTNNIKTLFCSGCTLDSTTNANALTLTVTAGGSGTVTSIAQTVPASLLTIGGSPITTSGTLAIGLANAGAHSYWGNNTGSSGTPLYVTNTQLTADLNLFTTTLQGLVPLSGGGTTNFLRADGTWVAPAGGGSTNVNIGSGYRWAVPGTNNIKTLFCSGCTLDSTTNTNALTLTVSGGGGGITQIFSKNHPISILGTDTVSEDTTFYINKGYKIPIVGDYLKDSFQRSSLGSPYTPTTPNATVTLPSSTHLHVTGGNNSFANFLAYTNSGTNFAPDRQKIKLGIVAQSNSANDGIGFGFTSVITNNPASYYVKIDLGTTNSAGIEVYNTKNLASTPLVITTGLTFNTGDSLLLEVTRVNSVFFYKLTDLKNGLFITATYTYDRTLSSNYEPNLATPEIDIFQGTQDVWLFQTIDLTQSGGNVLGLGDSIMEGYHSSGLYNFWMYILFGGNSNLYDIEAGVSEQTSDALGRLNRVILAHPKYVLINLGVNDKYSSVTDSNFKKNVDSLAAPMLRVGITPILISLVPQSTVDITSYNTDLSNLASQLGIQYVNITTQLETGTAMNPLYNSGDGVHPNNAGHSLIATIIKNSCPQLFASYVQNNVQINRLPVTTTMPWILGSDSNNNIYRMPNAVSAPGLDAVLAVSNTSGNDINLTGFSTSIPKITAGALNFQSYDSLNNFFGGNVFYNSVAGHYQYRYNGAASQIYFYNNAMLFQSFSAGTAGGNATVNLTLPLGFGTDGVVFMGGSTNALTGPYTGSTMSVSSTNVLVGDQSATPVLQVHVSKSVGGSGGAGFSAVNESTNGVGQFYASADRGTNSYGTFIHGGSASVATTFGLTQADKTFLLDGGANSLGLAIGTLVATPITFGTNNATEMVLASGGALKLNSYGSGTHTGTSAFCAAFDASGNIIEVTCGGGGSQTLTYTQNATNNNLAISGGNNQSFLTATGSLAGLLDTARAKFIDSLKNGLKTFNIYAANGLTAAAGDSFYLGGSFNQNTTLNTNGFTFSITNLPNKATALSTDSVLLMNLAGQLFKLPVPSGGGGSGTVTSVATGLGLSGGTITTTGTLLLDTSYAVTKSSAQTISGAKIFTASTNVNAAFATNSTVNLTGITNTAGGSTFKVLAQDTSTGKVWNIPYYKTDTTGYAAGNSTFRYNGTNIVLGRDTSLSWADQTITGNRTINIGAHELTLIGGTGTTNGIWFTTSVYQTSPGIADANLTITDGSLFYDLDPILTASRTITLPSSSSDAGRILFIHNYNPSFTWTFASTVSYLDGTIVTTLAPNTIYTVQSIGSQWFITNSFSGSSNLRYQHTIFTPSTGGTVALVNNQYNIIKPSASLATLTVNLPSSPLNNDVVYIKFTQTVSVVTYGNGTVVDGITAPVAGGLVVLTFDSTSSSWY